MDMSELSATVAERNRAQQACEQMGARIAELEAMATEMVYAIPGGSICDPQQVSDTLREIAAKHGVQIR